MRNFRQALLVFLPLALATAPVVLSFLCLASRVEAGERGIVGPPGIFGPSSASSGGGGGASDFLGEGIDFKGGMLDWDEDENGNRVAILRNYAVVILPQLTISARNMVLNVELQEIYAEGDVLFDEPSGNSFYCDQITFNYGEWKGLAKNIRVRMDRADVDLPVRDFLDQAPTSLGPGPSTINDASPVNPGNIKRMYVQAQELRAHDRETIELIDAKITPDSFAQPHWYFRSPAALYRRQEKIESYHNTVVVGKVPVLYFPYLIRDLQYDWPWMRIEGGRTGDYGFFVRTQWGWQPKQNPDSYLKLDKIIFDLDGFTRRGIGVGVETTYRVGNLESLGKLKLYGVYEFAISNSRDQDRAYQDNEDKIYQKYANYQPSLYKNDFRWAVDWEHYQQLNEFWDVRAEAHLYHDRDYLKDYDPKRYWNDKEPQNSIDLRRLDKQWELEFVAQSRLSNKWQTGAEYYPEMRLTVPGLRLWESPFFFKNDFRMGVVNKRFDEDEYRYTNTNGDGLFALDDTMLATSRLYDRDNYGSFFRAFNEMTIEAPLKIADAFTFKPWVGLRTAYYSKTLGTPYSDTELAAMGRWADLNARYGIGALDGKPYFTPGQSTAHGSGDWNYAVPFGADLSTRTYTIMGDHDQWRMITEPVLSYRENSRPRLDYRSEIYPIDRWDEYYRECRFGLELHSKLQRRDYEDSSGEVIPERDVLDFNVGLFYYPRTKDQAAVNHGFDFSELKADLVYRPTRNLAINASGDYDLHDNTFNRALLGIDWRLNNKFRVLLSQYHYRGDYWRYPDANTSSQTHLALRTKLWNDSSHYSLEGAVSYEWKDSDDWQTSKDGVRHGFNKYRITLFRDLNTFELALSYVRDRNANDHGIYFNLSPKGFMGFERPPPAYTAEVEILTEGRYPEADYYLGGGYLIDAPVADAEIKDVQF